MACQRDEGRDLIKTTAHYPNLRVITVPAVGTQEPQDEFPGSLATHDSRTRWVASRPSAISSASRCTRLLGVPVGLIHDSWGGSACEAWVPRELLEADPQYQPLMDRWRENETKKSRRKGHSRAMHRPGNLYNGMLKPVIGYGIRGAIWYQGESNAGRAYQYRQMFPLMIKAWRDAGNKATSRSTGSSWRISCPKSPRRTRVPGPNCAKPKR